jgi:ABC-type phosphate/phosphonate transport system substrate-binding protein
MKPIQIILLIPILLLLSGARPIFVLAQSQTQESVIHFALTSAVIEPDVNQDDAIAATKMWAATMGKGSGLWQSADAAIFRDKASLIASINRGATDIFAMGTQEFLELEDQLHATPYLTYMQAGQIENQYLMLVRQDSGIKTLGDLLGKRLAMPKGGRNTLAPLWLDVILGENGMKEKESCFKEIREVLKPTQAILPVFFKQMDAGIVIKSVFETAVALNPQIGQQTKILAASPKMVMLVVCMRNSLAKDKRERYVNQGLKLHEAPAGLQALNVIKLDRLVSWDPAYFEAVKDLVKKHKILKSAQQAPSPSDAPARSALLK